MGDVNLNNAGRGGRPDNAGRNRQGAPLTRNRVQQLHNANARPTRGMGRARGNNRHTRGGPPPTLQSASVTHNPITSHRQAPIRSWAALNKALTAQPITINLLTAANAIRTIDNGSSPLPVTTLKLLSENLPKLISNTPPENMNYATVGNWLHMFRRIDSNGTPRYISSLFQGSASLIAPRDDEQQQNTGPIQLEGRQAANALFVLHPFSNTQDNSELEPGLKPLCAALAWQVKLAAMSNDDVGSGLYGLQNLTNSVELQPELIDLLEAFEPKIRAAKGGLGPRFTANAFLGFQSMKYNEELGPALDKAIDALIISIDELAGQSERLYFDHIVMILKGLQPLPSGALRDKAIIALTKRIKAMPEIRTLRQWKTWLLERSAQNNFNTPDTTLIQMIENLRDPLDNDPTYELVAELYEKTGMRKRPTRNELKAGLSNAIYEIRPPTADRILANTMNVDFHCMSLKAAQINGNEALQRYIDDEKQTHEMRLVAGRQTHSQHSKEKTMWDVIDNLYEQFSDELVWAKAPGSAYADRYGAAILRKYLKPLPNFASMLRKERTTINRGDGPGQLEFSFGDLPAMHFEALPWSDVLPDLKPDGLWDSMQNMIARSQTPSSTGKWRDEGEFVHRGFKFKAVYEAEGQQIKRLKILYEGPVVAGKVPPYGMLEGKAVLRI